eukprot:EG_transcript_24706
MGRQYVVTGYVTCSFHERAVAAAEGLQKEGVLQTKVEQGGYDWYWKRLEELKRLFPGNPKVQKWETSPFIYAEDGDEREFIGGCDQFMERMTAAYPKSSALEAARNMKVWRDGRWTK